VRYCRVCSTSVLRIVNFSSLRYVRNGGKVCTTSTKIWKNGKARMGLTMGIPYFVGLHCIVLEAKF
jgi:hypothetical protein